MVRVGSLPRMQRGVLPFSVHAGGGSASAKDAAAGELREMLKHASSHQEAQIIRQASWLKAQPTVHHCVLI